MQLNEVELYKVDRTASFNIRELTSVVVSPTTLLYFPAGHEPEHLLDVSPGITIGTVHVEHRRISIVINLK